MSKLDWSKKVPNFLEHLAISTAQLKCLDIIESLNISTVMEVGIGGGQFAQLLLSTFKGNYIGIDGTKTFIQHAQSLDLENAKFICALMGNNDIKVPLADLIYLRHVLEHNETFQECVSWLAKHSKKYLLVINFLNWAPKKTKLSLDSEGFHYIRRTRDEFLEEFKTHGFQLKEEISLKVPQCWPDEIENILFFERFC